MKFQDLPHKVQVYILLGGLFGIGHALYEQKNDTNYAAMFLENIDVMNDESIDSILDLSDEENAILMEYAKTRGIEVQDRKCPDAESNPMVFEA